MTANQILFIAQVALIFALGALSATEDPWVLTTNISLAAMLAAVAWKDAKES